MLMIYNKLYILFKRVHVFIFNYIILFKVCINEFKKEFVLLQEHLYRPDKKASW